MHKALFRHQRELAELDFTHLALQLGLEVYRFEQALQSDAVARHVGNDYDSAVRNGITGTPTFFINGRRYRGAVSTDALAGAIRSAIDVKASAQR
jgi:predicted DsbA family dithiol-disulfide isomerase